MAVPAGSSPAPAPTRRTKSTKLWTDPPLTPPCPITTESPSRPTEARKRGMPERGTRVSRTSATWVLGGINPHQNTMAMPSLVNVGVLHPGTFEPQLHPLLGTSKVGMEWIPDKMQPVCAIDFGFCDQFDGFPVELYDDSRSISPRLSIGRITRSPSVKSSLTSVLITLNTFPFPALQKSNRPPLSTIFEEVLKSQIRRNEERGGCPPSDLAQLLPIMSAVPILHPCEQQGGKSK